MNGVGSSAAPCRKGEALSVRKHDSATKPVDPAELLSNVKPLSAA